MLPRRLMERLCTNHPDHQCHAHLGVEPQAICHTTRGDAISPGRLESIIKADGTSVSGTLHYPRRWEGGTAIGSLEHRRRQGKARPHSGNTFFKLPKLTKRPDSLRVRQPCLFHVSSKKCSLFLALVYWRCYKIRL